MEYNSNSNPQFTKIIDKSQSLSLLSKEITLILMQNFKGFHDNDEIKSLCPFHEEKTPSFFFNAQKGGFKCFGCGEKGNIIDLAKQLNISIPEKSESKRKKDYDQYLSDLVEESHKQLVKSDISYWTDRGIFKESITKGRIGLLEQKDIAYDVFPYYDKENKFITFKKLPREKKLRSKHTRWGHKGIGPQLYGLQFIENYDSEKPLLLSEGEKDFWILKQAGYQVIGIPAAQTYKKTNNKLLKDFSHIYIIFDNDKAGHEGSLNVLRKLERGYICKWSLLNGTSEKVNDVNDLYLLEPEQFNERIDKLINNAIDPLNVEETNQEINSREENHKQVDHIRINPQMLSWQKRRSIAEYIFDQLKKRGNWYYTDGLDFYYFEAREKNLYDLNSQYWEFFLHSQFGINKSGNEFEYIQNELKNAAKLIGTISEIHKTRYYDIKNNALYIFNNNNQIYKITESSITLEPNGIDGVLFLRDSQDEPINADLNKKLSEKQREKLIGIIVGNPNYSKNAILSPYEAEVIFETWLYSLFFVEKIPAKPILTFTGEKGSAKSFSLKLVRYLFYGNKKKEVRNLPETEDQADNFLLNNFLCFLDNVDGKLVGKKGWTEDWLATASTGAVITKRKLYTNGEEIRYTPKSFLAITSRTPYFKRDDIADRLLLIQLDRYEHFTPEMDLYEKVEKHKNDIWLSIFYELQEILKALKTPYTEKIPFRIAEYAKFSLQIAQHKDSLKEMQNIFKKLSQSQSDFTLEEEPIFMALDIWIENNYQNGGVVPEPNNGREIISKDLHKELKEIAHDEDFWFPKSLIAFSKRLSNIKSNLGKYYIINNRPGRSRTNFFTFSKKEEKVI